MEAKPWLQHLKEQMKTFDDYVGYVSACYDEGPETFALGLHDVLGMERQAGADAARRECAGIANSRGEEWGAVADQYWREGDHSNASVRQGWSAGAQCIANDILKLVGQPVKE